jgi:uncharacterized membrane protein
MTHQEATTVVAASLEQVEVALRDVTGWTGFLVGLEDVVRTSFGRYTFTIRHGTKTLRTVDVAVVAHPKEHRTVWRSLSGPRFDGEVRLQPVDQGRTRVSLSLTAEPQGLAAGLGDMFAARGSRAVLDLQRLEELVAAAQP